LDIFLQLYFFILLFEEFFIAQYWRYVTYYTTMITWGDYILDVNYIKRLLTYCNANLAVVCKP